VLQRSHAQVPVRIALALSSLLATSVQAEEMLRIAVAQVTGKLAIAGPQLRVVEPATGEEIAKGSPVVLAPSERGVLVNGTLVGATRLLVKSDGVLKVRDLTVEREVEVFQEKRGGGTRLIIVHSVPIETYVAATVSKEMPTSWSEEALKVQAVASRTFAVYRKFAAPDRPYHMEAGVIDQVYGGAKVHPRALAAVRATHGEVITYRRRPIKAYFHSCCAGHTESAREGWGQNLAYLPGVKCSFDKDCPAQHFSAKIPVSSLIKALRRARLKVSRIDSLRIVKRTSTGRVAKLVFESDRGRVDLSGEDLRRLVGYGVIKSRRFDARLESDHLVVEGGGSGHGVGLCQWGARGMASKGRSYSRILQHYYPRTRLMRMY